MGKINIQAATILPTIPQRTAESRLVAPTPMIAELTQWVVLTGIPNSEASSMTVAAEKSETKPWTGWRAVTLHPDVLTTRQPPIAVPELIANADTIIIHHGMCSHRLAYPE